MMIHLEKNKNRIPVLNCFGKYALNKVTLAGLFKDPL